MIRFALDAGTGVARVTLARPAAGNTLDMDGARALEAAVGRAVDEGAKVILLDAEGKLFCGGGDVRAMSTAEAPEAYTHELATTLHRALLRIAESGIPVVAAVQGAAAGAGLSLVLNADIAIASERASFVSAYLSLGVTPDGGASYLLPKAVGKLRASELMLGGRKLDADTAQQWGLVNEVVPADELAARADQVARTLAATPAGAAAKTKQLLGSDWVDGYRQHLEQEATSIAELIRSPESRERQAAFLGS